MNRLIKVYEHVFMIVLGTAIVLYYRDKGLFSSEIGVSSSLKFQAYTFVLLISSMLIAEGLLKKLRLRKLKFELVNLKENYLVVVCVVAIALLHIIFWSKLNSELDMRIEAILMLTLPMIHFLFHITMYQQENYFAIGNFYYKISAIKYISSNTNHIIAVKTEDNVYYLNCKFKVLATHILKNIISSPCFEGKCI